MLRKFKKGALYAVTSKREGSTFKMLVRLCALNDPLTRNTHLYLEDFATGELVPVVHDYLAYPEGVYEFEDEWDRFNVECVSTDVKSFIASAYNRIHSLV